MPLAGIPHLGQNTHPPHDSVERNAIHPRSFLLGASGVAASSKAGGDDVSALPSIAGRSAGVSGVASSILQASMASLSLGGGGESSRSAKAAKPTEPAREGLSGRVSEQPSEDAAGKGALGKAGDAGEGEIGQHYTLGRVLDKGSNGTVVLGVDRRTGEKVAVKIVEVGGEGTREDEGQKEIWQQVQHENMVRH